ncbi:hypothetical protein BDF21DRAFT_395382 [Thamnidium elegans]|nr:hypothetical protein BDF21DRAFT_395382 [Thamnidium elegans]
MPWVLLEFIWRRKYYGDLFGGMMKSLREVDFVPGDRQIPTYTEYGNVEANLGEDNFDNSSDVEESDDETNGDNSDDDYRPYPPGNSTSHPIIDQEVGDSNIMPEDVIGDTIINRNNEDNRQRRRLNDEIILPFGVVRRSRRIRIANISLS